jgi:pyruvate dehydrogenase E1 component alpha subunit/2-oxoisovalerate dehydrogenase E1 component alpha subunit
MSDGSATSSTLIAGLEGDQLLEIHDALVRARAAEERLEILFKQGHVGGGVYRSLGQEAGSVGSAYALRRRDDGTGDIIAQTIRETGAVFLMGGRPLDYFRQYLARGASPTGGREANVHWCDWDRGLVGPVSPLGTMVEIMAGITLSFRLKGEDRVGLVYYGDGASSTGAWHEGLNFAAVQKCPMVLMVEANGWAFSTPTARQTRVQSFTEKGPGYGIPAVSVDGTDVLAVYEATREAVESARNGGGVHLIEMRYYRRKGHAQHDPQDYVDPAELLEWEARDPIRRFRARLVEEGVATEEELDGRAREIHDRVAEAAEVAVEEPLPDPSAALDDVYTDAGAPLPWTRRSNPDPRNT